MRRILAVTGLAAAGLLIASPAQAFAHNAVTNVYLHAVLDVLTLAMVSAPLWTALLWGPARRGALFALVAIVQLPVAVIGFVPLVHPVAHLAAAATALAFTAASLWVLRRAAPAPDPVPARD